MVEVFIMRLMGAACPGAWCGRQALQWRSNSAGSTFRAPTLSSLEQDWRSSQRPAVFSRIIKSLRPLENIASVRMPLP